MEIIYDFQLPSVEGSCIIRFGFSGYDFEKRIGSIEFVVDIPKIYPKEKYSAVPITLIKTKVFKEFENFKTEKYDWGKL